MSLKGILEYWLTPAGLGALAMSTMWVIQKLWPNVKDDLAFAASVLISAAMGIGGYFLIPYVDKLPPEVALVIWPALTWAWNYFWFRYGPQKSRTAAKRAAIAEILTPATAEAVVEILDK